MHLGSTTAEGLIIGTLREQCVTVVNQRRRTVSTGFGAALDELDSVGVPAHLEATSPRNRILNERCRLESA